MSIVSIFDPRNVTPVVVSPVTFIPEFKSLSARLSYVRGSEGTGQEGKRDEGAAEGNGKGDGGAMCAFVHGPGVREFDIDTREIVPRRNLF